MKISKEQMEKLISDETDRIWNVEPEKSLVAFVQEQIESVGQPLTQEQLTALTKALTYITKATTKSAMLCLGKCNESDSIRPAVISTAEIALIKSSMSSWVAFLFCSKFC